MDKTIQITVRNKIATKTCETVYICGNSDFAVHFSFDDEWAAHTLKTARFILNDGSFVDQPFSGDTCPVPILKNTFSFNLGVYAGNLSTTTPAYCPAKKSILCPGGTPKDPEPDVYNEIIDLINTGKVKGDPGAPGKDGKDGQDGKDGKDGIDGESGVYVGSEEPTGNVNVWIDPNGEEWQMPEKVFGKDPIITITTEEDVRSFILTEDNNKVALSLKAVLVKLTIPIMETTTNGYIKCGQILGDEACAAYFANISSTNGPREATFVCYPLYGRWFALSLGAANEAGNTNTVANYPVRNMRVTTEEMPVLKHVTISISAGNMPKGTTVKVWGVRA